MKYICMFVAPMVMGCMPTNTTQTTTPTVVESPAPIQPVAVLPVDPKTVAQTTPQCTMFDDFTDTSTTPWTIVNDNVMGGRSLGEYDISDGILRGVGYINTNGGGFSSVRAPLPAGVLANHNSVKLRLQTDGRAYQIGFRDANTPRLSHRAEILVPQANTWQDVTIPFADLVPAFFGRSVDADAFAKDLAQEITITLNDRNDGDFGIAVDTIWFCNE